LLRTTDRGQADGHLADEPTVARLAAGIGWRSVIDRMSASFRRPCGGTLEVGQMNY
jgi:hypothetical protein